MARLSALAPELSRRVAALTLDMRAGNEPSKETVGEIAKEMREAQKIHSSVRADMANADDFQAREYAALTEAALVRRGGDADMIERMVELQISGMEAFAAGRPPPMPTRAEAEAIEAMQAKGGAQPALLSAPEPVAAPPFAPDAAALRSPVVREELDALTADHRALIVMGEEYGTYDGFGQAMFLDRIEAVEERWAVFMGRFKLMGDLNPAFVAETERFLGGLGLTPEEYLGLHGASHAALRRAADLAL